MIRVLTGDCREVLPALPAGSVHCCVTSPPYFGLRDYGVEGQIGLEASPNAYIAELVAVFRQVRRVLRDDGTLWLNLGDSYCPENRGENAKPRRETLAGMQTANPHSDLPTRKESLTAIYGMGIKRKDLMMIPARVALALQADGWWLRSDIIWAKPNPMPESVTDRPTSAHEHVFLLSKRERYWYDAEAVKEAAVCDALPGRNMTDTRQTYGAQNGGNGGLLALRNKLRDQGKTDLTRNLRNVWTIATQPFNEAHFATFPPELAERCIKAGCPAGGTVLDPFAGAGTTGLVADRSQRDAIIIELNPEYAEMGRNRMIADAPLLATIA